MLGSAAVCALRGHAVLPACVVLFGELACIAAAAHVLLRARRGEPSASYSNVGDTVRFFLVAGLLLPSLGAAWHIAASDQLRPDAAMPPWGDLAAARALAYLLIVPVVLVVVRGARLIREARASLETANARLGALARVTLQVQEEERSRIARDLHDDISQSLAAISIEMSALRRALHGPEQARAEEIQEGLLAVSEDVRRISHDLHPSMLRYTSLGASLVALCEGHTLSGGLRVECEAPQDLLLSDTQKINLFRIAQEGIHNVERHARATIARVSLTASGGDVLLCVEDNGIGLAPGFVPGASQGLGMVSIGERMRLLGGRFSLSRREGGGTRLVARCPLRRTTDTP
jgi:signal transduction histidine kinase